MLFFIKLLIKNKIITQPCSPPPPGYNIVDDSAIVFVSPGKYDVSYKTIVIVSNNNKRKLNYPWCFQKLFFSLQFVPLWGRLDICAASLKSHCIAKQGSFSRTCKLTWNFLKDDTFKIQSNYSSATFGKDTFRTFHLFQTKAYSHC